MASAVPSTMRAFVLTEGSSFGIQTVDVPAPIQGSVLLKVEAAMISKSLKGIIEGTSPWFSLPRPVIPGGNTIGRVAALGPDTTSLQEGQLVHVSSIIRARDDPQVNVLWGATHGFTPASQRLYASTVRNGAFAEYVLAPLESVTPLDEARLTGSPSSGGLGYSIPNLLHFTAGALAFAALRAVDVHAGERVLVSPATGLFSGAVVDVAVAMGIDIFAAGRNTESLAQLKKTHPLIKTITLTGDLETDKKTYTQFPKMDAVIDVSPPQATGSSNIEAAASALRPFGRFVLMGGRGDKTIAVSFMDMVFNNLTVRGVYMFTREHQQAVARLAEMGLLKLGAAGGHEIAQQCDLDGIWDAVQASDRLDSGVGKYSVVVP